MVRNARNAAERLAAVPVKTITDTHKQEQELKAARHAKVSMESKIEAMVMAALAKALGGPVAAAPANGNGHTPLNVSAKDGGPAVSPRAARAPLAQDFDPGRPFETTKTAGRKAMFVAAAPKLVITIGDADGNVFGRITASARIGNPDRDGNQSCGWYANGKVTVPVNGDELTVQVGGNFTVVHSKQW